MKRNPTLLLLIASMLVSPAASPPQTAPEFSLPRFDEPSHIVRLADQAGKIVVLDFFAYWCVPCARSSPVVEEQIQKHYARQGGNPNGVPVQVISINVEPDEKKRTSEFIRKHGISLAVNDKDGETLKAFGGEGLPFFVVLDGTQGKPGAPIFRIVYSQAGFEGVDKLRGIVDRLGTPRP